MNKIDEINVILKKHPAVILYFFNDNCAPCIALRPKVSEMLELNFSKIKLEMVNAGTFPELSAHYGVFSSPAILVFFEAKEVFRSGKNISTNELYTVIDRYYSLYFS